MRALLAFDKFKDALSAPQACALAAGSLRARQPDWTLDLCPLTDGGEGVCEILTQALGGTFEAHPVTGPRGGVSASEAAFISVPSACCALRTRNAALPEAAIVPSWSFTSCTEPVPRSTNFVGVCPVMCSTAEPANSASTSPATALAEPGPVEVITTPSPSVARA